MRYVSVFGLGYVGAVTASCLAHIGHRVIGVDVNPAKVEMLNKGLAPVLEPQLEQLTWDSHQAGRLCASTRSPLAVMVKKRCRIAARFEITIIPSLRKSRKLLVNVVASMTSTSARAPMETG